MNDRIFQKAGDTAVTATVWLQDALSGALKTGVTIANLDYKYIRIETDNDVTITGAANVVALSALTDAHADGKMLEIGEGAYRLDLPDAMLAAGADYAQIIVWDAANDTILPCVLEVQLAYVPTDVQLVLGATPTSRANTIADVGTALNTAIPGSPTANSINERVKTMDDKLPASPAAVGSQMDIVNAPNATGITAFVTAIFAKTGITAGGTWTFAKILKVLAAWAAGKWQDKSGSPGTYEVLDAEDGTTKILEVKPGETSPQKDTTVS